MERITQLFQEFFFIHTQVYYILSTGTKIQIATSWQQSVGVICISLLSSSNYFRALQTRFNSYHIHIPLQD